MNLDEYIEQHDQDLHQFIVAYLPQHYNKENLISLTNTAFNPSNIDAINYSILSPIKELLSRGSKKYRSYIYLLLSETLNNQIAPNYDFVILIEFLHAATLMLDDIEDSSQSRRGRACIHQLFGPEITLNASCALLYLPLSILDNYTDSVLKCEVYELYRRTMLNMSIGQALDLSRNKSDIAMSEADYLDVCKMKTGSLFALATTLASLHAKTTPAVRKKLHSFGEALGTAFQIQDDLLNLTASSNAGQFISEYIGSDIGEGKRTLPYLYTVKNASDADKTTLHDIYKNRMVDKSSLETVLALFTKYNAINYSSQIAQKLIENAWFDVETVLPDVLIKKTAQELVFRIVNRAI